MRVKVRILFILIVVLLSTDMAAQSHNLPEPQMSANTGVPPPPPGLPIDFGISALIAAGLGLGIHHLRNKK